MKTLILDFGNTNQKLAIFENNRLVDLQMFPRVSLKILHDFTSVHPEISYCILASVVRFPVSIRRFLSVNYSVLEFDENTRIPLTNKYKTRKSLGGDRLAAAVAGNHLFRDQPVLVVNAGSCITYDFINSRNEYLGGAISPGLNMRFQALHTFTGKLPLVTLKLLKNPIGNTTEASIISGVGIGTVAEIEGVVGLYQKRYPDLKVILSGGDINYFDKRLKISIFAFPNIVIHGLSKILEFNVNHTR